MFGHHPHSLIRRIYIVLGIFIIAALLSNNYILYSKIKGLKKSQSKVQKTEFYLPDTTDEVSMAMAALVSENATYRANLKRQRTNLKECLAKLPQNEIDDFYKRHQEELRQEMAK